MIQLTEVTLMRGSKVLLRETDATINPGQKVGLIGANGCGKSSLFALLRDELQSDHGEVSVPQGWDVVSVAQETPASPRSALDYVIDGDTRVRGLQQALEAAESAGDGQALARLHGELQDAGAYDIEARAATILAGLGFAPDSLSRPVSDFSGGWRMRLNLAQALLCHSDLLLLDEPTNHLDLDAVIWLEKWLARYSGTLMLISHDKAFLDATVDTIVSVEQQQLISYTGNYSSFEKQRAERIRLQDIEYQKQQQKRAHLESFINRFKAKASKAKQAQSRIKQLEKLEDLLPAHSQSPFSFSFFEPPKLPNPLIKIEHVQAGYGDKVILENVHLNLVPGSRIGLLGRNGAGKSTLIKLLAQAHPPLAGSVETSSGLRIGYFAQHQLETLRADDTPLAHLVRLDKNATEQQLRDYLGGFGFNGDAALSKVAPMSGGEKARLVLALMVYQKPNLLLLDEPTNHLDLEMRHALNLALQAFSGAMVLVSHDRFLLSSVCDDFYLVDSGQVAPFQGDLDDYRDWLLNQTASEVASKKTQSANNSGPDRKTVKRLEAEFRQATKGLRETIKRAERQMHQCQQCLQDLEQTLADTSLYEDSAKQQLRDVLDKQQAATQQLQDAEAEWLEAQEMLEQQQAEFDRAMAS
ncbi:ATP-binding cassette domain-containing protein [Aestuariibacter halophilus]|uniref:ATP-binding cassette domain-containing protein n=1 Tax=Fluctibacter halophilus TaxID=226011 RepID=A0ABS8G922_9ALTE|nr:ATP-binding cassette domain-containing protein [Aestuariibacter halophilus]MCC2617035.1 ATP-binding cassette domain-containing protein [Aestuariibacter halophilus]